MPIRKKPVKNPPEKNPIREKEKRSKEVTVRKKAPVKVRKNGVTVAKPTSKSTWKGFERKVATDFGTKRVPLSGSNSGHNTNSDSLHENLYIECKVRSSFSLWELYEDSARKAKVENKIPLVAIKKKGGEGYLILINPKHLAEIKKYFIMFAE